MNFRKVHGSGIFGSNRKEVFQIDYLSNMGPNEIIIRRSDIDQTFPLELDLEDIVKTPQMNYENIGEFMKEHGYDLEDSEKRIIQQARKTIFKKDFDNYFTFINEIINYMEGVKKIHKIGNLYKKKLREDLMSFIYPRAIKIAGSEKKKREILNWRNNIFNILLRHGYLVENHPRQASGSESIRTSYSVGPQYEKALKDYYDSKRDTNQELFTETISTDSNETNLNNTPTTQYAKNTARFIEILESELATIFEKIFTIYRYVKSERYLDAQKHEKIILKEFFERLYSIHEESNIKPSENELESFIDYISSFEGFPLNHESLKSLLNECKNIELLEKDREINVARLYEKLNDLFNALSLYVSNS